MATVIKPTAVVVSGASQNLAVYKPVIPHLHRAGYPTMSVYLPSVGVSLGLSSFDTDVKEFVVDSSVG